MPPERPPRARDAAAPRALPSQLAALVAGAAAAIVLLNQQAYRTVEANVESALVNALTPVATVAVPTSATVITGVGTHQALGLTITPFCSSAPLVGGFLAVTAVLLAVRRWSLWAIATALVAGVVIVVAANLLRISIIIWATRVWNHAGFEASHVYVGTFVTLFGLIVAIIAYLQILGAATRRHAPDPRPPVAA